jgi:hypothetical protein
MFGASIPVGFRCFAVVVFVVSSSYLLSFISGCWLESSIRVFSFFREVFVLFSLKLRSSFAPRRVASCPYLYNAWYTFWALVGITVRVDIRCEIDVVLTCVFGKNHTFFVCLASDSISQPHGEGDFAIHYTIDTQLLGRIVLISIQFLFWACGVAFSFCILMWLLASVNCLCLERASFWHFVVLAVVVVYVVSSSFRFPYYCLVVGVFRKGF